MEGPPELGGLILQGGEFLGAPGWRDGVGSPKTQNLSGASIYYFLASGFPSSSSPLPSASVRTPRAFRQTRSGHGPCGRRSGALARGERPGQCGVVGGVGRKADGRPQGGLQRQSCAVRLLVQGALSSWVGVGGWVRGWYLRVELSFFGSGIDHGAFLLGSWACYENVCAP